MRRVESGIEVAVKALCDGSKKNQHLAANILDAGKLPSDNQMIQLALLRKNRLNNECSSLIEKKLCLNKQILINVYSTLLIVDF